MHIDAIKKGQRVVIVDDLLATENYKIEYKACGTVGRRNSGIVYLLNLLS